MPSEHSEGVRELVEAAWSPWRPSGKAMRLIGSAWPSEPWTVTFTPGYHRS